MAKPLKGISLIWGLYIGPYSANEVPNIYYHDSGLFGVVVKALVTSIKVSYVDPG